MRHAASFGRYREKFLPRRIPARVQPPPDASASMMHHHTSGLYTLSSAGSIAGAMRRRAVHSSRTNFTRASLCQPWRRRGTDACKGGSGFSAQDGARIEPGASSQVTSADANRRRASRHACSRRAIPRDDGGLHGDTHPIGASAGRTSQPGGSRRRPDDRRLGDTLCSGGNIRRIRGALRCRSRPVPRQPRRSQQSYQERERPPQRFSSALASPLL